MTDKEKLEAIRAEIHRLVDVRGYDREMANDLFTFMDSLPNEPVSDDLEEACEQLAENARKRKAETSSPFFSQTDYKQGVIDGAEWQKQQTISKACKWIDKNAARYLVDRFVGSMRITGIDISIIEDFRKDMEDE